MKTLKRTALTVGLATILGLVGLMKGQTKIAHRSVYESPAITYDLGLEDIHRQTIRFIDLDGDGDGHVTPQEVADFKEEARKRDFGWVPTTVFSMRGETNNRFSRYIPSELVLNVRQDIQTRNLYGTGVSLTRINYPFPYIDEARAKSFHNILKDQVGHSWQSRLLKLDLRAAAEDLTKPIEDGRS